MALIGVKEPKLRFEETNMAAYERRRADIIHMMGENELRSKLISVRLPSSYPPRLKALGDDSISIQFQTVAFGTSYVTNVAEKIRIDDMIIL